MEENFVTYILEYDNSTICQLAQPYVLNDRVGDSVKSSHFLKKYRILKYSPKQNYFLILQ